MPSLYNCRHDGDQFRITKFNSDFNVESSYLLDVVNCQCPAGHRPTCRHREMLPKFLNRNYVGSEFFFDYDRGGWVQGSGIEEPATETVTIAKVVSLPDDASPEDVANAFGNLLGGFPDWCLSSGECTTADDCVLNGCAHGHGTPPRSLAPAGLGQTSEPSPSLVIKQYNASEDVVNSISERELLRLTPSPSQTIRRRV